MLSLQLDRASAQQNPQTASLISDLVMFGCAPSRPRAAWKIHFEHVFQLLMRSPPQPEQGGEGNVKSSMEIQAEAQTAQGDQAVDAAKVQVHQQKNAVDMANVYTQAPIDAAKLQQDATFCAAELGMQQHAQKRTALDQAWLTHMVSRAPAGLA